MLFVLHLDFQFYDSNNSFMLAPVHSYDLGNSFMLAPKDDLVEFSTDLGHAEWEPARLRGHGSAPGADGGGTKSPRVLGAENSIMRYFHRKGHSGSPGPSPTRSQQRPKTGVISWLEIRS